MKILSDPGSISSTASGDLPHMHIDLVYLLAQDKDKPQYLHGARSVGHHLLCRVGLIFDRWAQTEGVLWWGGG